MTKEELDRIKKAYSSGLKVQIWFDGYWKDFDIRDYSMYAEPFSENRQYRIVGSDYADIAEKHIAELEEACNKTQELLDTQIEATYKLDNENAELKELVEKYRQAVDKCLHITFMGGGCEVNTIGQYATLVDGYLTDVEGLAKWKD